MKCNVLFLLLPIASLFLAGCETTDAPTTPVSWRTQEAYLKKMRDPRIFGLHIANTPSGMDYVGGGRLHPERMEPLEMLVEEPLRPVVGLCGAIEDETPVLLDLTSAYTWLSYGLAHELRATPVGTSKPRILRIAGEDIDAYLSTISSLRLGQMFIEHPMLYVRMATGSLGPLARGIEDEGVQGVVGWDLLRRFEYIQFVNATKTVVLSTGEGYDADPGQLVATIPLVSTEKLCVAEGKVNDEETLILIDPAGDFEVAVPEGMTVSSLQLGDDWVIENPAATISPRGIRIGAKLLEKYLVTICPEKGEVYVENMPLLEK